MPECLIQRQLCPLPGHWGGAEVNSIEICSPRQDLSWLSNGALSSILVWAAGLWHGRMPTQQSPQVRENATELHNEAR